MTAVSLKLSSFLSGFVEGVALPKRKSVGQHKQTKEAPQESRPSALAELAAARGITEAEFRAAYESSLKAHGETAEDNIEDLRAWVIKFVEALWHDENRFKAWETLKSACNGNVLPILYNLYLFTYPTVSRRGEDKTTADVLRDATRFLKDELDKLIARYGTLHKDTSDLLNDPKLKFLGVLSTDIAALFREPANWLSLAKTELIAVRNWAERIGSLKTEVRDLYLYSMATHVRRTAGEYHFSEITTLIEAAFAAHGWADEEPLDEKNLERRVQRYVKRMNLSRTRPTGGTKQ